LRYCSRNHAENSEAPLGTTTANTKQRRDNVFELRLTSESELTAVDWLTREIELGGRDLPPDVVSGLEVQ
jgi:hypothetical protein